jgi:hypothetical protein
MSPFDYAVYLARAEAMRLVRDSTSDVDRHNDERSLRGDMLERTRASDIEDMALDELTTVDERRAENLLDWIIDALFSERAVDVVAAFSADKCWLGDRARAAATKKATTEWERRYGVPDISIQRKG